MGKPAEYTANYVGKGRLVAVQGSIRVDKYVADDGNNRSFTKVAARNIQSLESAKKSGVQGENFEGPKFEPSIDAYDFIDDFKEKIRENHEEWNRYHVGDIIELQEIVLEDVEDIDYTSRAKVVSEIVVDDEVSEEKQIACWKDYEVEQ